MSMETPELVEDVQPFKVSALEQSGGLVMALATLGTLALWRWQTTRRRAWFAVAALTSLTLAGLFWLYRAPQGRRGPAGLASDAGPLWPVDGRLAASERCHETQFLGGPAQRLVIAVPAWMPQVVWAPGDGVVAYRRYEPANRSADGADSLWLGLTLSSGERWLMRWVASAWWRPVPWFVARRIVCGPDLGDRVHRGEVIGHLPLGGRVELYLPADALALTIPLGRRIWGGRPVSA
ncbi:MAG: hypothetical protein NZ528_07940 [Caldilineales bacterium]|nr:hypothetical protein [Caldilineales bacterium]MDW8318918.1 hypothetical protein [Anaerolineae bacterium]